MAVTAENDSTSPEGLTVESAASSVFDALLSAEPEYREDEPKTQPAKESPAPEPEPAAQEEADPEPAQAEDGKSQDDEQTEEAPAEEPPAGLDPSLKVKVKVDGKDEEVTLEELQKGYSRTKDYTRKTQDVAERRKALETETVAARQERAQLAEHLKMLETAIDEVRVKEPDWDKLRIEHPDQFPTIWAEWNQGEKDRAELRKAREAAEQKVAADQQAVRQERMVAEGEKLLDAIPEWKDEKVRKTEGKDIQAFMEGLGYSLQDLQAIDDHRAFVLIRKAMQGEKAAAKKADAVKRIEVVKTTTPGPVVNRPPVSNYTRAVQRLAKTHSRHDAQSVFEAILDAEEQK